MKIYFYDGRILDFLNAHQKHFNVYKWEIVDADLGPKKCYENLRSILNLKNQSKCVLTNSLVSLSHVFGWNSSENHTDIYIWCDKNREFVRCDMLTQKEIREAHNIEKIYMSNGFEDHSIRVGNPNYNVGDEVSFTVTVGGAETLMRGKIEIVDPYGTFEQNVEPSYDIMVDSWMGDGEPTLVKHIRESSLV